MVFLSLVVVCNGEIKVPATGGENLLGLEI